MKGLLHALFVCFLFVQSSFGQEDSKLAAFLSDDQMLIGEQASLSIKVPLQGLVQLPVFSDTLPGGMEIVERYKDTISVDGGIYLRDSLILTSFDTGLFVIPPIGYLSNDTLYTPAYIIEVNTVKIDTNQAFRDIYEPEDLGYSFEEIAQIAGKYLAYSYITIALLALLAFAVGKDKNTPLQKKAIDRTPSHVKALRALQDLKQEELWQSGKYKEYHFQLSEILRTYIEVRYRMPAMESTSDEVLDMLKQCQLDHDLIDDLRKMLSVNDMAKFAKAEPFAQQNEAAFETVLRFVEVSKPKDQADD